MFSTPVSILIIVENLPVPFDRRVWQEGRALTEAGYRVSIICPKSRGFEKSRETREGIEIYRHALWEAASPLGYLIEYTWALVAQFLLAVRIYARTRFRIVHACNPPDLMFLVALVFRLLGVRFIFDHHDLNPRTVGGEVWQPARIVPLAALPCRAADVSYRGCFDCDERVLS